MISINTCGCRRIIIPFFRTTFGRIETYSSFTFFFFLFVQVGNCQFWDVRITEFRIYLLFGPFDPLFCPDWNTVGIDLTPLMALSDRREVFLPNKEWYHHESGMPRVVKKCQEHAVVLLVALCYFVTTCCTDINIDYKVTCLQP